MEKVLGRKLTRNEIVHHKDESFAARSNNDPDNLKVVTRSWHAKHHKERQPCYIYKRYDKWILYIWKGERLTTFGSSYITKEDAEKAFITGIMLDNRGMNNVGKTHCKNGHEFVTGNTYIFNGVRRCKICRDAYTKNWRDSKKVVI
jgi:hypothetical protein